MVIVDPAAERRGVARQVFKPHPKFLSRLEFALPVVVRSDGSSDLRAGGEVRLDRAAGQPVGVGTFGGGCPSHEHGGSFAGRRPAAKPKKMGERLYAAT